MIRFTVFAAAVFILGSCASNPDNIDAAYVSPLKYATYDCGQIGQELGYVGQRTNVLYQNLKEKRRGDNWQMGVGLILFWPTLFALEGGDGSDATEYAQLKGEYEALRQNSTQKRCSINMQSPDEILSAAREADAGGEDEEAGATTSLTERLQELQSLREQELITEEEYTAARQSALEI